MVILTILTLLTPYIDLHFSVQRTFMIQIELTWDLLVDG